MSLICASELLRKLGFALVLFGFTAIPILLATMAILDVVYPEIPYSIQRTFFEFYMEWIVVFPMILSIPIISLSSSLRTCVEENNGPQRTFQRL